MLSNYEGHGPTAVMLRLSAQSFLYNQVRLIVGTLVEVGLGHMGVADVQRILDAKDRNAVRVMAPPSGLYLAAVEYPSDLAEESRRRAQEAEARAGNGPPLPLVYDDDDSDGEDEGDGEGAARDMTADPEDHTDGPPPRKKVKAADNSAPS